MLVRSTPRGFGYCINGTIGQTIIILYIFCTFPSVHILHTWYHSEHSISNYICVYSLYQYHQTLCTTFFRTALAIKDNCIHCVPVMQLELSQLERMQIMH